MRFGPKSMPQRHSKQRFTPCLAQAADSSLSSSRNTFRASADFAAINPAPKTSENACSEGNPECLSGRATTRQGGGGTPSSQESRVRLPRASEARGSRRFHGRGCLHGCR
jgi:hypothetical protein